jgi:hypothetical protein
MSLNAFLSREKKEGKVYKMVAGENLKIKTFLCGYKIIIFSSFHLFILLYFYPFILL